MRKLLIVGTKQAGDKFGGVWHMRDPWMDANDYLDIWARDRSADGQEMEMHFTWEGGISYQMTFTIDSDVERHNLCEILRRHIQRTLQLRKEGLNLVTILETCDLFDPNEPPCPSAELQEFAEFLRRVIDPATGRAQDSQQVA